MIYITKILRVEKIIDRQMTSCGDYDLIIRYEIDFQNDEGIVCSDSFKSKEEFVAFLTRCQFLTVKVVEILKD